MQITAPSVYLLAETRDLNLEGISTLPVSSEAHSTGLCDAQVHGQGCRGATNPTLVRHHMGSTDKFMESHHIYDVPPLDLGRI